jgi:hypothetical protein
MAYADPFLHAVFSAQEGDARGDVVDVGWVHGVSVCVVGGRGGCWVRGIWGKAVVERCDAGDGGRVGAQEVGDGWFSAGRGLERVAPGTAVDVAVVRLVVELRGMYVHGLGGRGKVHYP